MSSIVSTCSPTLLYFVFNHKNAFAYAPKEFALKHLYSLQRAGLLTFVQENAYNEAISEIALTPSGKALLATANIYSVFGSKASAVHAKATSTTNAFASLWTVLMTKGVIPHHFGDLPLSSQKEAIHLAACGIHSRKSSTPTEGSWAYFNGTFVEPEIMPGLRGEASCNCGFVNSFTISYNTNEGLANLLANISNPVNLYDCF